jgi:hypothetical protein
MEWILPILLICISLMIYFYNFKKKNNLSSNDLNAPNQQEPQKKEITHDDLKKELCHRITDYLNKNKILYTTADGGSTYRIIYENGENDEHQILIEIPNQKSYIKFSCLIFRNVPDDALSRSAEIVTRINNRYILGNLMLMYEERLIIFEANMILTDIHQLTEEFIELYLNESIKAGYWCKPLIKKVIIDHEEPIIALLEFIE